MDPFANSDLFQKNETNVVLNQPKFNFSDSNKNGSVSPEKFGEPKQDNFFRSRNQLIPLTKTGAAETSLRQRNTMTKYEETSLAAAANDDFNIPSFSQLEGVSTDARSTPVSVMTTAPQGPRDPEDLGRWVVVFGFSPGDYTSPIRALQNYGQITKHCPGGGGNSNYLFVQFATVMDRNHAVSLGATLLSDNVLISVSALTPELASRLGFSEAIDSTGANFSSLRGPFSPLASPNQRMPSKRISRPYSLGDVDTAIAQPPRRHVNFCKKVARALFGW